MHCFSFLFLKLIPLVSSTNPLNWSPSRFASNNSPSVINQFLSPSREALSRIHIKSMHIGTHLFCIGWSSVVHRPTIGRPSVDDQTTGHRQIHSCTCVLHNYYVSIYNTGILYLMPLYKYINNYSVRHILQLKSKFSLQYHAIIPFDIISFEARWLANATKIYVQGDTGFLNLKFSQFWYISNNNPALMKFTHWHLLLRIRNDNAHEMCRGKVYG